MKPMKECIRIAVTFLCLFAAKVEAKEFAFDFSSQRMDNSSVSVFSFSVGDTINLSLPYGQPSFSLKIVSAPPPGIAGQSFIAKDTESSIGAIVKPRAGGLHITVDDFARNKIYTFNIKDGNKTFAVREKTSAPDECATCNGLDANNGVNSSSVNAADIEAPGAPSSVLSTCGSASRLLASSGTAFPLAEQKTIIDILVAFDQGAIARAAAFGYSNTEEFADYAVDKMNMVLEKSQLLDKFSYRLVGIVEVDATYDVINDNLLNALRLRNSGALAPVGVAREKYGADTITLLIDRDRNKSNTAGLGYEYLSNSWSYASFDSTGYTCNICDIKTVYERYTMSHETGHNMGCGHSNRQGNNSGPGCNPYSCGYHFQDAAGTNRYTIMAYENTSPASGTYYPVPYFSSPDITPEELGVPVGTPTNNNRLTILNNYKNVSEWREHIVPYSWDVRFLDSDGNDIPDGTYFVNTLYVTLTNDNPNATIYYTFDGSTPGPNSYSCSNGQRFTLYESKTITACAVTNGVAMSVRTVTFNAGQFWSGESGRNGSGAWADDSTVLAWDNPPHAYDTWTPVVFSDIPSCSAATVSVCGAVAPYGSAFLATDTSYTFAKGTTDAALHLRDTCFAPSGDLTFNVPVQLDAVAFTNPASHTLAFNAPFGQALTATTGYCTNMIGIGASGTLAISPGAGNTQTFDCFNNVGWFYNNAKIRIGTGTVVFKGPVNNRGLFGSTQLNVTKDGCVVLDMTSASYDPFYTSAVSGEGTIVYRGVLPSTASRWTTSTWKGTIAFEGLQADNSTKDFHFENYGNADSKILLRNCEIYFLCNHNTTFPGTLILEDDGALRFGANGYSNNWNIFGVLEGNGSISASSNHKQTYVFNTATNYTGSITINAGQYGSTLQGRRIVFGMVSASGDLPSQSATITVKQSATASIGGGATWYAYHGVEIGGTLLVKGANATLDCNASAAMGLKLDDGATLRFDAADASLVFAKAPQFASGTINIAFANGVTPTNGMVLVRWPDNSPAISGNFAFADPAVAARWTLNKTATGLVVENAPLPEKVPVSITVRYFGDDGWEDKSLGFELPSGWVTNYYPSLDTIEAITAKYNDIAANGADVWQCYMLGLDPTNATSKVSLAMTVVGNEIHFAIEGLGETHALEGIQVQWTMKTSTNLVTDAGFTMRRDYTTGLSPTFAAHPMPDKPTSTSTTTVDTLFYKVTVSFVAEDGDDE